MIKAAGKHGTEPLLILGLSGENMTRLMAKEPILLDTSALGLPQMRILILGGRTEDEIQKDIEEHFTISKAAS